VYEPEPVDCPKWYWIFTNLENENDSVIEKLGCTDGCGATEDEAVYNYYVTSPNAPIPEYGNGIPEQTPTPPSGSGYYGCINQECISVPDDTYAPDFLIYDDCLYYCKPGNEESKRIL